MWTSDPIFRAPQSKPLIAWRTAKQNKAEKLQMIIHVSKASDVAPCRRFPQPPSTYELITRHGAVVSCYWLNMPGFKHLHH